MDHFGFLEAVQLSADAPAASALEAFERPRPGTTEAADWGIAWWKRVWSDDALEDHPMIDVAFDWLEEHAPVADRISFLHGDYRTGNFLFDADTNRVTAILDWEMATIGDPLADLAWALSFWRQRDDPPDPLHGALNDVFSGGGWSTRTELIDRYEKGSGRSVTDIMFYTVMAIWNR